MSSAPTLPRSTFGRDMASAYLVLTDPDSLRSITTYQAGLHEHVLPTWSLLSRLRSKPSRGMAMDMFQHWPLWLTRFGIDAVPLLIDAIPCTKVSIVEYAASAGRVDLLHLMHTRYMHNFCGSLVVRAASNGHTEVVQYLFAIGCAKDVRGAVQEAAIHGHVDVLQVILDTDAVLKMDGIDGDTIAAAAVQHGHVHVLDWLLERSTQLTTCQRHQLLARWFDAALRYKTRDVAAWLASNVPVAMTRAMQEAWRCKDCVPDPLRFTLADIDHPHAVLTKVLRLQHWDLLATLQRVFHTLPSLRRKDKRATQMAESQCFVHAIKHSLLATLRWLVDVRKMDRDVIHDIVVVHRRGRQAMARAMTNRHLPMVRFLVACGIDAVPTMTKILVSALMYGKYKVWWWLVSRFKMESSVVQEILNTHPRQAQVALHLAIQRQHIRAIEFLQAYGISLDNAEWQRIVQDLVWYTPFLLYLIRLAPQEKLNAWFPRLRRAHDSQSRQMDRWYDWLVAQQGGRGTILALSLPAMAEQSGKPNAKLMVAHAAWRLMTDSSTAMATTRQVEDAMMVRATAAGRWKVIAWLARRQRKSSSAAEVDS
ncbi:Aste57867_19883 [Aphanomyces stellatus]|uniref:Aste57867_19883 protein n=1 Tax=Aphanomyces stellatus TaxID=120398 RepID=A0A485LDT1_9STRA|nr:hypothetical protein As57867_019817 [Aphanomyces stellatus]VFT96581.1 Aste57867_19883 [Aphanomyces stellatus]